MLEKSGKMKENQYFNDSTCNYIHFEIYFLIEASLLRGRTDRPLYLGKEILWRSVNR